MEIKFTSLEDRLKLEKKRSSDKYKFHRKSQEKIDFLLQNEWLQNQDNVLVKCDISTYFSSSFTIHISNVQIDKCIEQVLGPLHRKFNVLWKLHFGGDEKDPVYVFTTTKCNYFETIEIRVKEGEFRTCMFKTEFSHIPKYVPPSPVYNLQMVCE